MTSERKEAEFAQGYWVEWQDKRFAGGVSAEALNFEGGLGAVYAQEEWGVTGYLQYALPFLSGRIQVDLLSDQRWVPQVVFGVPLTYGQLKLEPNLVWTLEKDKPTEPSFGIRVQYTF